MISARSISWLFDPPDRLPAIHRRRTSLVRRAVIVAIALAAAVQVSATAYAFYELYRLNPVFRSVGISPTWDGDYRLALDPLTPEATAAGIKGETPVLAVGSGTVVAVASVPALGRAIEATSGNRITLRMRAADGKAFTAHLTRSIVHGREIAAQSPISSNIRTTIRLMFALLCAVSLLGSAMILVLKRSRDPEAMLIALAFATMASITEHAIHMWLSLGLGWVVDYTTFFWWVPIVIAIAAFPDGRFEPRWTRWSVPAVLVCGVAISSDYLPELAGLVIGVGMPMVLLAAQIVRYRRLKTGIERQQLKWAAFAFAIGFALIAASLLAVDWDAQEDWAPLTQSLFTLGIVGVFSLGLAIPPLGLLVSLLRFRLWEVDTVISRSAAYAFTTTLVGIVWAATSDLVKTLIANALGEENTALSVIVSTLIAAIVFTPTQAIALSWSKRRLNRSALRIESLPKRLRIWCEELEPAELGMRALAVLTEGVHAESGAILIRTPIGREVIAASNLADPATLADLSHGDLARDARVARLVTLADDDGPVGWLALGARDDGNRYSRDQIDTIESVVTPLAEALRIAISNAARTSRSQAIAAPNNLDGQPGLA